MRRSHGYVVNGHVFSFTYVCLSRCNYISTYLYSLFSRFALTSASMYAYTLCRMYAHIHQVHVHICIFSLFNYSFAKLLIFRLFNVNVFVDFALFFHTLNCTGNAFAYYAFLSLTLTLSSTVACGVILKYVCLHLFSLSFRVS